MIFFKRRQKELTQQEQSLQVERDKLELERQKLRMAQMLLAEQEQPLAARIYETPWLPDGVVPKGETAPIAQDSCSTMLAQNQMDASFFPSFLGYPQLAMLSQSSDYRSVPETTAAEMTRKWGEFKANEQLDSKEAEELRTDKIERMEKEFKRLGVRELIQRAIETEMTMGRAQIFIDLDHPDTSLPFVVSPIGVRQGALRGLHLIEPMWSTPSNYNASDPLADDFFKPSRWFVMGRDTHADRLITLVMRPVPDILKPAYNFGGVSMLQLMMPYVQRYQRTADSVADLIHNFSLTILSTDMSAVLAGETDPNILMRVALFNKFKSNDGMMMLDKEVEEVTQINTPLSGLSDLVSQAQEQMAAPSHTPLVKLLGITPSGLNASAEGEIEVYRDYISAQNEAHIRPIIERISELVQLSLFGEIDQTIVWKFNPLKQMDERELAEIQEIKARTSLTLLDASLISQGEGRLALSQDEASPYSGIDAEEVPETPDDFDDFDDFGFDGEAVK